MFIRIILLDVNIFVHNQQIIYTNINFIRTCIYINFGLPPNHSQHCSVNDNMTVVEIFLLFAEADDPKSHNVVMDEKKHIN